jgi:hypothetical protein
MKANADRPAAIAHLRTAAALEPTDPQIERKITELGGTT